jgi:hypothetical protein
MEISDQFLHVAMFEHSSVEGEGWRGKVEGEGWRHIFKQMGVFTFQ